MLTGDKASGGYDRLALVTFNPVTLEAADTREQCDNLLRALDETEGLNLIFTKANADEGGSVINGMLDKFVADHPDKSCVFTSLGQRRYLSAVSLADVVVGNSSSGLSEVPSFNVPTVNVGSRQKNRECGPSVISCGPGRVEIKEALERALSSEFKDALKKKSKERSLNPYEMPGTSDNIVRIIKEQAKAGKISVNKHFYMV